MDVSAAEMKHRGGKNMKTVNYEDISALIDALVEYGIVKLIDEPKEQGEQ